MSWRPNIQHIDTQRKDTEQVGSQNNYIKCYYTQHVDIQHKKPSTVTLITMTLMLSVIMLCVVMLNVVAPKKGLHMLTIR
jgi:hypothetical protein